MTSVEMTRAAVRDIVEAFAQGDFERLAKRYDDDIDWMFYAPVSVFPFCGPRRGKAAVFQAYAQMFEAYKLEQQVVEAVVADADRAAILSDITLVQKSTGRTVRSRVAGFYRFRDGLMIEYRGFVDSFDAAEQALGRWIDIEPPSAPPG
jgi:ketosteroid isomerase-like protein